MKADDPRLEAARKAAIERVEKYNAIVLATIKGHLAIEEALDSFIEAAVSNPVYVLEDRRFMFASKANICLALSAGDHIDNMWSILWAMNHLRNKVAHTQELDKIKGAMAELRKVYFNVLTPRQVKDLEKQSDEDIVVAASGTCAGFILTISNWAKERRTPVA